MGANTHEKEEARHVLFENSNSNKFTTRLCVDYSESRV